MAEYDAVVEGSASKIIGEFQAQSIHRRRMERFIVYSDAARSFLGLFIGGGIAIYMVYIGSQLIAHGKSLEGFGSIGTAIALGAVPFAVRAYAQHQERIAQNTAVASTLARRR